MLRRLSDELQEFKEELAALKAKLQEEALQRSSRQDKTFGKFNDVVEAAPSRPTVSRGAPPGISPLYGKPAPAGTAGDFSLALRTDPSVPKHGLAEADRVDTLHLSKPTDEELDEFGEDAKIEVTTMLAADGTGDRHTVRVISDSTGDYARRTSMTQKIGEDGQTVGRAVTEIIRDEGGYTSKKRTSVWDSATIDEEVVTAEQRHAVTESSEDPHGISVSTRQEERDVTACDFTGAPISHRTETTISNMVGDETTGVEGGTTTTEFVEEKVLPRRMDTLHDDPGLETASDDESDQRWAQTVGRKTVVSQVDHRSGTMQTETKKSNVTMDAESGEMLQSTSRTETIIEDQEGSSRQIAQETTMQDDDGYILRKAEEGDDTIDYATGQRMTQSQHHNVKMDACTGEVVHDATVLVDSVQDDHERTETRTFRVHRDGEEIDDGVSTITERRDSITGEVTMEDHNPDSHHRRGSIQ